MSAATKQNCGFWKKHYAWTQQTFIAVNLFF